MKITEKHPLRKTQDCQRGRLILLELNEINFDLIRAYAQSESLPAFEKILTGTTIRTSCEKQYEQLEPWIQWPSVHTGLTANEHGVFRLGDILSSKIPQIFEQLEEHGLCVGSISAMNAENRLRQPAYFIPDPWTKTPPDKTWWSRVLSQAVSQAVNDNARSRISAKSALHLALALLKFAQLKNYDLYLYLALKSFRAPWRKALLLDLLLHDVHYYLFNRSRPDFSTLFLNAGAHIQHHYLFNAQAIWSASKLRNPTWYAAPNDDPIKEMLKIYDRILGDYLEVTDAEIIISTGLSQRPYDRIKFYYRLKEHAQFLRSLGIRFNSVLPRMTRDFLVEFDSSQEAAEAKQQLAAIKILDSDEFLFGAIDNRGTSLFVTLTYAQEINNSTAFSINGKKQLLSPHVAFVAIKNGMHQEEGFAYFTPGVAAHAPADQAHVKDIHKTIMQFFTINKATFP